jgi:hypothetical chaperone protein
MRVGLDFGTTNSSAAVFRNGQVKLLRLDPINTSPSIMRSTLFITREGVPFIGREAIQRFTEANVGREINYQWRYIGETEITLEDDAAPLRQALFAVVDANEPGRLFQSLKTHLRDASFIDTNVFGVRYTLEQLIAVVLKQILTRIETELGEPATGMVIGRPVHYALDAEHDALAIKRMRHACELAGLPPFTFLPEPTAAALSYASTAQSQQHILVFDFGGGTLDVTVMRIDGHGERTALATEGVPIGGDLMDRRIMMGKLLPHFGAGATLGARRLPFPAIIHEHMVEWQSISELNQPRYLQTIEDAIIASDKPREMQRLYNLVRNNYGLPLYEQVERAKVHLSDQRSTIIGLDADGVQFQETIERWDFDRLIGPDVRAVAACVDRAVEQAGLRHDDIDVVLRTGGSSRVPRFIRMLSERFGAERLREMDVFTGVASGLGIAAADDTLFAELQAQ